MEPGVAHRVPHSRPKAAVCAGPRRWPHSTLRDAVWHPTQPPRHTRHGPQMPEHLRTTQHCGERTRPVADPWSKSVDDAPLFILRTQQRILLTAYCLCVGILGGGPAILVIAWYRAMLNITLDFVQVVIIVMVVSLCAACVGYLVRYNKWAHWALLFYGGLVFLVFVGFAIASVYHVGVNQPRGVGVGLWIAIACLLFGAHGLCGVAAAACGRSMRRRLKRIQALHGFITCQRCNYDLRGSVDSNACPECGELIPKATKST